MTENLGGIDMKKIRLIVVLLMVLLCGCYGDNGGFDQAMQLRTGLLNGNGCSFDAAITADFGDKTYSFGLSCQVDAKGNLEFTVQEPDYIEGITGNIQSEQGKLTFDDTALAFPIQADGILSPVSGPWVMIKALRSGYVRLCGTEEGMFRMTVDDSYNEDALTLDIWVDGNQGPVRTEIYEENRRIMTIEVKNFQFK